jgi:hypothetical protein
MDLLRKVITGSAHRIGALRARLEAHYPGAKEEIDEALAFWAEQARRWC